MSRVPQALVIAGTRPELIKLAPVIHALARDGRLEPMLGLTGQHCELAAPLIALFGLRPAFDLALMRPGQRPADLLARGLAQLAPRLERLRPALVVVQGDTVSALAGALAAFYGGVPLAHVEAGLRAPEPGAPQPEEGQRRMIARLARWHFAPTTRAADALRAEGVPVERIHITGNSGIDALRWVAARLPGQDDPAGVAGPVGQLIASARREQRPLVIATVHRRENRGVRLQAICAGLRQVAGEGARLGVIVHPSPDIAATLAAELGSAPGVTLLDPPPYPAFVALLTQAQLAISDSGGLQEEAPALGLPLLVLREATERPEAVEAGVAALVGADPCRIAGCARAVLRDSGVAAWMGRRLDLFGDGRAGERIAATLGDAVRAQPSRPACPERVALAA